MAVADPARRRRRAQLIGGALAGPLFIGGFTALGAGRPEYDWRRHPVSSLAIGRRGWLQRTNFAVAGALYCGAARGLRRRPDRRAGARGLPELVAGVGLGLIGSGLFVTDPVGGFPPGATAGEARDRAAGAGGSSTAAGRLHNLCAIPIFAGIPVAGLVSAAAAGARRDYAWAAYCAASSLLMTASFILFGRAFASDSALAGKGGIFQRLSIASGLGWLTTLSLRSLHSPPE